MFLYLHARVPARKSTIISIKKRDVGPAIDLFQETPKMIIKPFTKFNIDNIVKEKKEPFQVQKPLCQKYSSIQEDLLLEKPEDQNESDFEFVSGSYSTVNNTDRNCTQNDETLYTNKNDGIRKQFKNDSDILARDCTLNETKIDNGYCIQNHISKHKDTKAYEFGDKSSEVKHALTPVNNLLNDKEDAQLSLPSPSYPTPASVGSEPSSILCTLLCANDAVQPTPQSKPNTNKNDIRIHSRNKSEGQFGVTKNLSTFKTETVSSKQKQILHNRKSQENTFTVLNIPSVSFHQNKSVPPPSPPKRQRLSKLDIATIRRKMQKEKLQRKSPRDSDNCKNQRDKHLNKWNTYCSCSSESEEEQNVDLWIRSGPPNKLNINPEKLRFLKLFQLTTHYFKNCK